MEWTVFTCTKDDEGRRLEKVLKRLVNEKYGSPFSLARKKLVRLNEKKCDPSQIVHEKDRIFLASFLLDSSSPSNSNNEKTGEDKCKILPDSPEIKIVFKTDDILFINKNYGMPVQPSKEAKKSVCDLIKENIKSQSLSFIPSPLHRLDTNTTGLLAVSLSLKGAREFSKMLQEHSFRKIYLGLAQGHLEKKEDWEDFIEKTEDEKKFKTVKILERKNKEVTRGKEALTKAIPLAWGKDQKSKTEVTLVQYEILTGRKHQIRAQSAFHGYPLFGDRAYGSFIPDIFLNDKNKKREFYLHSSLMIFPEENSLGLPQEIRCKTDEDFDIFLKSFLINWNGKFII